MSKRAIDKDFDDPAVQNDKGPSLADLWSAEALERFGPPHDTAFDVGRWFDAKGVPLVLDVGCGSGVFKAGYSGRWIGLDRSIEQLKQTDGTRLIGEALTLPFPDATFPGVVANYVLYFFTEPERVVEEIKRVLEPGGWFGTCAPSKYDCPELAHVTPSEADAFMAEDIPDLLFKHFREIELTEWDFPFFDLIERATVADYLYSHYFPELTKEEAAERAEQVEVPLKLTKRGIWGVGRKPG